MADFAIIETGGKQYKAAVGSVLKVEKLPGTYKPGDKVSFGKVLLVADKDAKVGMPYLGNQVEAEYLETGRAPKVTVIKYKAKSRYFKKRGHRQPYSKVKITAIK
ncbi:MAG TPA: 50S ribosomal protein L21 [Candidatus Paceibacterota bacterium]|nr:50S ribosomal protein L21 [Candidatus Paceibacterota bacterium]